MAQYLPGSVVYSLTAEDREAYRAAVAAERGPHRRLQVPLGFVFVALGLLEIATSVAASRGFAVHGRPLRPTMSFEIFGPAYVIIGLAWIVVGRLNIWFWFGRPKLISDREIAWDEAGITLAGAGEATRTLPWTSIRRVRYVGDCISIERRLGIDVVPARAFPDGGGDFMIYADERLVGKRLLVRASSAAR